jgi:ribosomal protein L7/L12
VEWIAIGIVAVVAFLLGFGVGKSRNTGGADPFPLNSAVRVGAQSTPGAKAASPPPQATNVTPGELPDKVMDEVQELLLAGNKIEAIKLYRKQTGSGLKEAKDAVEAIQRAMMRPRGPA